jgi:hypothetical protein
MADDSRLGERLGRLGVLDRAGLRQEWRELFGCPPPSFSRDLLLRALAYRIQELEAGGLPRTVARQLSSTLAAEQPERTRTSGADLDLRPGLRLVREWHGRTHVVTVTENGFEHAGRRYQSLSEIARAITGTRWSGPRFFAPTRRERESARG